MISCPISGCRWKTICPSLLGSHLRRIHEPIDVFTCSMPNCGRRFSLRPSFISHIRKHIRNQDIADNSNDEKYSSDESVGNTVPSVPKCREENLTYSTEAPRLDTPNLDDTHVFAEKGFESQQLVSIEKIQDEINRLSIGVNLKWLSKDTVPRNLVFEFQDDVRSNVVSPIADVVNVMTNAGLISAAGSSMLKSVVSMFNSQQTEYKLVRELKQLGLYREPVYFSISNELKPAVKQQNLEMIEDDVKGVLMPIKFQLKKYLESEGLMDILIDSLKPSQDGVIRSLVDGTIWQNKICGSDEKSVVPINIFFDDFTTSDTVSPHASSTKICGVYYYIPCLPPYILSRLNNILTAGYFLAGDRKQFGNERTLYTLVEVLSELENIGLNIMYKGDEKTVYFKIGFVTGDNLGLSEILNLVESPSANYYCRVCTRTRKEREIDCKQYDTSLRSEELYNEHIQLNDVSRTGIKHVCILNQIPSFHVSSNVYFDVMHDVPEGICLYGLSHCLNYFVYKRKYFTLDDLNCRKNLFVYGNLNSSNIPDDIKDTNLSKQKIRMTANEIITLTRFLPLIIGKLVPNNDPVWIYLCSLLKIFDLVMLQDIPVELISMLKNIIEFHHTQYVALFEDSLKPKHHNLVHYATAILSSGSLRRQWGMRCEAKHKQAKQYTRANYNKRNICSSLITKASFKFAYDLFNNTFVTPLCEIKEEHITKSMLLDKYNELMQTHDGNIDLTGVRLLTQFTKQGSVYQQGTIFCIKHKLLRNIYQIESIFTTENEELILVCVAYNSVQFDEHIQSYELKRDGQMRVIHNILKLDSKPINIHHVNEKPYYRMCNFVELNSTIVGSMKM